MLPWMRRERVVNYVLSAIIVGAAVLSRHALTGLFGNGLTYITFYPAVMLAGTIGGLGPGIFATLLSAVAADYWFLPPSGHLAIRSTADLVSLCIFSSSGAFMSSVAELHQRSRARTADLERELAVREGEARFLRMIEQAPIPMSLMNREGVLTYSNERFARLLGYTREGIRTLADWWRLAYPDEQYRRRAMETWGAAVRRAVERRSDIEPAEYSLTGKDGAERIVEISGIIVDDNILATFTDLTDRKRAEDALRRSEVQLRTILDNMDEGLVVSDLDGNLVQWNSSALTMHGFDNPDEGLRRFPEFAEIFELSTPEGVVLTVDQWPAARILRGERLHDFIVRIRRLKSDWERVFSYGGTLVRDTDGRSLMAVITITDITRRFRAQQEVAMQAALLQEQAQLLDLAHILIRDPEDRIIIWNSGAEALYGFSREEAIGQVSHDLLQTVFPESKEALLKALAKTGRWQGELIHTAKNGARIVVASHQVLYRDEEDAPTAVLEVNNDITEQRRVDEALRESEERFRLMVDSIPQLAWMAQPDGYIFWYNSRWYEYTGTSPEQMEGWGWQSVHDPEMLPKVIERWTASIATGEPFDMEFPLKGADGRFRWFLTRGIPMKDSESRVQRWLGTNTDITEQFEVRERASRLNLELEQRVAARTVELQAANKELEAFSYSVSHDLRAPLRAIDGFSSALLRSYHDQVDARGQDYLGRIRAAAQRMGELIDDLLGLSRATRAEVKRQEVDLSAMVREITGELRRSQPERKVELVIQPGVTANVDPHLIRIAMQNLLSNAWKFTSTHDEARIEFGVSERDGERVYYVRDNGAGFDQAYVGKLFTPFQRLHTEAEFPGAGIGLALVHRVVAKHGGRIWAEGSVGRGAEFSFTLE